MRPAFIGAIGLIVRRLPQGRALYVKSLGLPLRQLPGTQFLHSTRLGGGRYFGVWPLAEAARACFGTDRWPTGRRIPQMFIEFEMASPGEVAAAATELERRGHRLLHGARRDPWGQTVARLQTDDGVVVGISFVPWMHRRRARWAGSGGRRPTRRPSVSRSSAPRARKRLAQPLGARSASTVGAVRRLTPSRRG